MKYKSALDKDLIRKIGADSSMIMAELKKAFTLQTETYKHKPTIQKIPVVITCRVFKAENISYGFNFESVPELGKETLVESYPAYTEYVVAVMRPLTELKGA